MRVRAAIGLMIMAAFCELSFAHHSLSAEFDLQKTVMLSGVITRVEWSNPHAWFFVDVIDARTNRRNSWGLELPSPEVLARLGWNRGLFKSGTTVSVAAYPSRDGSRKGCAQDVTSTEGTKLFKN